MADFLILDDANAMGPAGIELLKAARVISDDDGFDIASLKAQGVAVVPFVASMISVRDTYLRTNAGTRAKNRTAASLSALLLADGVIGSPVFAPTVVVGNIPAGDPEIAQPAPFQYFSDTGNGAGVAAAFAAAAASGAGAWVHVRRGLYDLGAVAAPALPLAIDGFRVTGDGCSTVFRMSTLDRRLFVLTTGGPVGVNGAAPELAHIGVDWTVAASGAVGTVVIDAFGGAVTSRRATLENIEIIKNLGGASAAAILNPDEPLLSIFSTGFAGRIFDCKCINVDATAGLTLAAFRIVGANSRVDQCAVIGTNFGYRIEGTGALVQGCSSAGGGVLATHTCIESAAAGGRIIGNSIIGNDGIVLLSGGGAVVSGNNIAFVTVDGIRIDLGALNTTASVNALNGFSLVNNEPTAVAVGNAP